MFTGTLLTFTSLYSAYDGCSKSLPVVFLLSRSYNQSVTSARLTSKKFFPNISFWTGKGFRQHTLVARTMSDSG